MILIRGFPKSAPHWFKAPFKGPLRTDPCFLGCLGACVLLYRAPRRVSDVVAEDALRNPCNLLPLMIDTSKTPIQHMVPISYQYAYIYIYMYIGRMIERPIETHDSLVRSLRSEAAGAVSTLWGCLAKSLRFWPELSVAAACSGLGLVLVLFRLSIRQGIRPRQQRSLPTQA